MFRNKSSFYQQKVQVDTLGGLFVGKFIKTLPGANVSLPSSLTTSLLASTSKSLPMAIHIVKCDK